MKKTLLATIFCIAMLVGCGEEQKQECQDQELRQLLQPWSQKLDVRLNAIESNLLYLKERLPDPNE